MLGKLIKTIVDVGVKLPMAIIADVVTFGGIAIDQPVAISQVVEQIIEDMDDLTTFDKKTK